MRKAVVAGIVAAGLAAAMLVGLWFYATRQVLQGMFGPKVATDAEARGRIEAMGIAVPENARALYYCRVGFEEPVVHVGMDVPTDRRREIIDSWLGVAHNTLDPVPLKEAAVRGPEAYSKTLKTDLWDAGIMKRPVCYVRKTDPRSVGTTIVSDCQTTAIYDADGERVLLFYWHE